MPGRPNAFTILKGGEHVAAYLREKFGEQVYIPSPEHSAGKLTAFVEAGSDAQAYFANIIEAPEDSENSSKNWQNTLAVAATTTALSAISARGSKAA